MIMPLELKSNFGGDRTIFYDENRSSDNFGVFFNSHKEINQDSIFDFLLFGTILPPSAPLEGVNVLMPGETRIGGESMSEYENLGLKIKKQGIEGFVKDFEEFLGEYFKENSEPNPAVLLSGGIDSAILLSFLGAGATCVTWGGWGRESSDVIYSRDTAAKFGVKNHHFVYADYDKDLEIYLEAVEEIKIPILFQNSVPHLRMAEFARNLGIRNCFMGQNADTVLVSYPAPFLVNRLARLNRFLPFNPAWFLRSRKKYLFSTPSIVRLFAYFKSSGLFPGPWIRLPEGYFERKEALLNGLIFRGTSMQRVILTEELLTEARRNQICQNEMPALYGIRVRCPYYEKKFVELALSIPGLLRKKDGYGKVIFKELARKRGVPEIIINKEKRGLTYGAREFISRKMHIPVWDKMGKDDFLNKFINIALVRREKENNFETFDCLRSLYYWGELVYKKRNLTLK